MKKKICVAVITLLLAFIFVCMFIKHENLTDNSGRYHQHKEALEKNVNTSLGQTEFEDADYKIGENFESHLPLVIIDLKNNEIPVAYEYDNDKEYIVKKEGIDPYTDAMISVIDNEDNDNKLSDEPDLVSDMKIKYRGNSSLTYAKHQYKIKLLDESGNDNNVNMMGMGKESDWIINESMQDTSLIRNYMVYNICGEFMPYVPDVRYCEMIIKNGDDYYYEGLYLMMECVKQGEDSVDITEYNEENQYLSYIVRRDRFDEEENILDTYASKNKLCYGSLELKYPSKSNVSEKGIQKITNDISRIEEVIFSKDEKKFLTYEDYIDEDSFVDYFIVNEFFANYDAGNNSTYMYKDAGGKLSIGPVWDYDGAMDNSSEYIMNEKKIAFVNQPWFKQLIQSQKFDKKLIERYEELRKTYFSEDYINDYIDSTVEYLGNARLRDWDRWKDEYTKENLNIIKDRNGVLVNRNYDDYDDEIQRLKDVLYEHAQYIEPELEKIVGNAKYEDSHKFKSEYGVIFIVIFFAVITVVRRKMV